MAKRPCNRDLSGYDPDGPLPDIDPDPAGPRVIQGRAVLHRDPCATVAEWRELAAARGYSLRDLAIHVGTPAQMADRIDAFVQQDGSDGFILGSHLVPSGLDEFVDKVVPLLQKRGSLHAEYKGRTLWDNLGIPTPTVHASAAPPAGANLTAAR